MTRSRIYVAVLGLVSVLCLACKYSAAGNGDVLGAVTPNASAETVSLSAPAPPPPDRDAVMKGVAERYTNLTYYKCSGNIRRTSNFDNAERPSEEIPFEIEYSRGKEIKIAWHDEIDKTLHIQGKKSWLETEGRIPRSFSSPKEGLDLAGLSENGWSMFAINNFLFRTERGSGKGFFLAVDEPELAGEDVVDGASSYLLSGTLRGYEGSLKYWIDKETFVIRKFEKVIIIRKTENDHEYVQRTTTTETYSDIAFR